MSEANRSQDLKRQAGRIALLDVARGVALLAMAVYHFTWDLEFFGYADPGLTAVGGWKFFARYIASTFLFLVGVSLFLAHRREISWPAFMKRWAMVAGAAALISLVTWTATPDSFIFFGILHQIAVASLLGLLFLRLPAILTVLIAAAVIALPFAYASDLFNHPALWWVGLSTDRPRSNDFVPLFPWFGAVLLGIAAATVAQSSGLLARLRMAGLPRWTGAVQFLGTHSLAFYLIHQPLLIALVWLASQIVPPTPVPQDQRFIAACQRSCGEARSPDFCTYYCTCMLDELQSNKALDSVMGSSQTAAQKDVLQDTITMCTYRTEDALPALNGK